MRAHVGERSRGEAGRCGLKEERNEGLNEGGGGGGDWWLSGGSWPLIRRLEGHSDGVTALTVPPFPPPSHTLTDVNAHVPTHKPVMLTVLRPPYPNP